MSGCAAVGCSNRGDKGFFMKSFPRDPQRRALWASKMNRDCWKPNNNSRLCEVHFDDDQWEKTRQDGTRKLKCNAVPTLFENSKRTLKRKREQPKSVAKYPNNRNVRIDEENGNVSSVESRIELLETVENSMHLPSKTSWKSILRNNSIPDRRNTAKSNYNLESKKIKCSAMNCSSQNEAHESGTTFYKFPTGDSTLLNQWLRICDKDLKPDVQSVVCGKHFTLDCFKTENRLLLKNDAVPTLYTRDYCDEVKSTNLVEEINTLESSDLHRNLELNSNQNQEMEITKLENTWCRLCATSNGKNYIPIFGNTDLAEKISRCLPIIVLPSDNLPLQICQQCLYNLNISYKLIIGSLKADSFLRSEFLKLNKSLGSRKPVETPSEVSREFQSTTKEDPVFRINGPIRCDLCDDFFQDMNLFDMHIETTHLLQWRCSFCDHSFETSQELLAHKTLSHSGQIVTCKGCVNSDNLEEGDRRVPQVIGKDRKTDDELDSDLSLENSSGTKRREAILPDLKCTKCKIVFDDAKEFRQHHTIHLPRHIKCSVCSKRCPSIFDYHTHMRIAHNQIKRNNLRKRNTVHGCKYCKKVFLIRQQLVIHLRKHKKEMLDDPSVTVYKCVTCPKKFVDRALYQKHRNVHDPACWHKFRCHICNRSFMDRFKLKIHQSIHDGVKPYQCDVCGRVFNRNANMIRHRVKHFEQTCRHCEKTFKNTKSLREHLRDIHGDILNPKSHSKAGKGDGNKTNSNSDNFVCGYCGKLLSSYYSLLDHERIHTGDKPYVCQRCGKAFRSITARWDHMVRHEKGNYVCELCGKIMSNRLNLRRHLRKHAAIEQKRFECKECGKLFHVRWRLNAHLIRIHHSSPNN